MHCADPPRQGCPSFSGSWRRGRDVEWVKGYQWSARILGWHLPRHGGAVIRQRHPQRHIRPAVEPYANTSSPGAFVSDTQLTVTPLQFSTAVPASTATVGGKTFYAAANPANRGGLRRPRTATPCQTRNRHPAPPRGHRAVHVRQRCVARVGGGAGGDWGGVGGGCGSDDLGVGAGLTGGAGWRAECGVGGGCGERGLTRSSHG